MASKKRLATIVYNANTIEETEVELEKAQGKCMSLKERRNQGRKEHFLDFLNAEISGDEERHAKAQNQVIKRVKK